MTEQRNGITRRRALKKGAIATGAVFVGGTATTGTATAGIGDGRVGHYHLNNIRPDGTVVDASPVGNHGTNNGATVVRGAGQVGNAVEFDGADYIAIDNAQSLTFGDSSDDSPFSIAGWVKIPEERNGFVVGKGLGTDTLEYVLNVDTNREWAQFRMYDEGGGSTIYRRVEYPSDNIDEWHHVVGTYDGSGKPSGITVFVDGEIPATVSTRDTNYTAMHDKGADIEIGAILRENNRFGGFLKGQLDEVRIYDRALSAAEVQSLASMGGHSGGGQGNGQDNGNGP